MMDFLLQSLLESLESMAEMDFKDTANMKAMVQISDALKALGAEDLTAYIGDMDISVSASFFDDEDKSDRIIIAYAKCIIKLQNAIYDSFDKKYADKIFKSVITQLSLKYSG